MLSEIIATVLENILNEVTAFAIKGHISDIHFNEFLKKLENEIKVFCKRNECTYINSFAFESFLKHGKFIERILERAIVSHIEFSSQEFLSVEIEKAKGIANAEHVEFSLRDEQVIKDLFNLINSLADEYYQKELSTEQRYVLSAQLKRIAELEKNWSDRQDKSDAKLDEILQIVKGNDQLTDTDAIVIADLFADELYEGRFSDFDNLAKVVKEKSNDLAIYYECVSSIFRTDECSDSIKRLSEIKNTRIRDNAIRTVSPILVFRKESLYNLLELITDDLLREIIKCLVNDETTNIISEKIVFEEGLEIHNLSLNKKFVAKEERLVIHIAIVLLHSRQMKNLLAALEELGKKHQTWLTELLIADIQADSLIRRYVYEHNSDGIDGFIGKIQKRANLYDCLCNSIRALFHSIIVKANLAVNRIEEAEKNIPKDLISVSPLSDFVYSIRIMKYEAELSEVLDYSTKNNTFWLLNNYFIVRGNKQELIDFCQKHEDVFEKDPPLFFIYLDALKSTKQLDECKRILEKYRSEFENVYEYWNECLNLADSTDVQKAFIDACKDGIIICMFYDSEYSIIERLLNFEQYNIAELYIARLEKTSTSNYRIKKYKAIVQHGKKNDVEALRWFKSAFEDNTKDSYIIDSIISLSLINNRIIDKTVIDAALQIDTSRINMLLANCYLSEGNISKAKNAAIRSIMLSQEDINPAFGLFMGLISDSQSNPTAIGADTAALCKKENGFQRWLCVYKEPVLPTSPHIWNNDYHIYLDDAAGLGYLRKQKGNSIKIDDESYEIVDIIPVDSYLFRACVGKLAQNGLAEQIVIPTKNGELDVSAFRDWAVQHSPDERKTIDWLEQYNNIKDVPLPLYTYKRFTRFTYLQFVDLMLCNHDIFIREAITVPKQTQKCVISFSALVALYNIGFPAEKIYESGGVITESTLIQIDSDVAKIIKEYNQETVASYGVLDGKLFFNEVDDSGKDYWLKKAGSIKKYCKSLTVVNSEYDLSGHLFENVDIKNLLGICDYDALSFVQHNTDYSLVSMECFLNSLSVNEDVQVNVLSVPDWLVAQKINAVLLIDYIKKLMNIGCLLAITKSVINYLSEYLVSADDSTKAEIYTKWNELLSSISTFPDKQKSIILQAISTIFTTTDECKVIDKGILQSLIIHVLNLRNLKMNIRVDEKGEISFSIEKDNPGTQDVN